MRGSALSDRSSFPEDHPLYAGPLPLTIAGVSDALTGYDLVIAIGAQVFRYYPFVAGDYMPEGTDVLQITADPHLAAIAPVGDSLLGDMGTALEQLLDLVEVPADRKAPPGLSRAARGDLPEASRAAAAQRLSTRCSATVKPEDAAVVMESTSTMADLIKWWPTRRPGSFFATGSGGIGWGVPAAVGVALGDRARGVKRPIVATIGDGSFQYSIQAIWTAAQHKLPIVFVVQRNGEYAILKSFALLGEDTQCTRAGPARTRHRVPGRRFRLPDGHGGRHRGPRPEVQGGTGCRRTHRPGGAHAAPTAVPRAERCRSTPARRRSRH